MLVSSPGAAIVSGEEELMSERSGSRDLVGSCLCGAVTYSACGRPDRAYACHCRDCQKRSGSAFAIMLPVAMASFHIEGETFVVDRQEANGVAAKLHLCGRCFTRLYTINPIWGGLAVLRAGTLADTFEVRPAFHIWTQSRQPWFALPSDVPHFETQPASPEEWRALLG